MKITSEIIFFFFFSLTLVEAFLSYKFIGWYFKIGLPLKTYTTKILYPLEESPSEDEIQDSILESQYVDIEVRKIGENTYGFRESIFNFMEKWELKESYTHVVRGNLYFDFENKCVKIKAIVNWYILYWLVFLIMLGFSGSLMAIGFAIIWIFLEASIYYTQIDRYKHVARMAASIGQKKAT